MVKGKPCDIGLGGLKVVSLAEARRKPENIAPSPETMAIRLPRNAAPGGDFAIGRRNTPILSVRSVRQRLPTSSRTRPGVPQTDPSLFSLQVQAAYRRGDLFENPHLASALLHHTDTDVTEAY